MNDQHHTADTKLDAFPTYRMSESAQHRIHQNVMKALEQQAPKQKLTRGISPRITAGLIAIAALFILTILSLNMFQTSPNTAIETPPAPTEPTVPVVNGEAEEEPEPFDPAALEQRANAILQSLDERDMATFADYVHEEKGLLLSPYLSVSDSTVHFSRPEIATLLDDEASYLFGYGEANTEIRITTAEYFEQHLQVERFFEADKVFVDTASSESDPTNYLRSVFPDAKVVEFYTSGTEQYSGLDWRSLHMVFEQEEASGEWRLIALINNLFTP